MPAADTPVPARARTARFVLFGLLVSSLGGLSLTGDAPVTTTAAPTLVASAVVEPAVLHGPSVTAAALATKAAPARRTVRATRSRVVIDRWVRPSSASVVSRFGPRWGRTHDGIDFGGNTGDPVRAVGNGVVLGAGYLSGESGYGKIVLIRHKGGAVTAYAHLSRTLVRSGERVKAGELIGKVGSTGHSTGPHLHFEVRVGGVQINPIPWLRMHGVRI